MKRKAPLPIDFNRFCRDTGITRKGRPLARKLIAVLWPFFEGKTEKDAWDVVDDFISTVSRGLAAERARQARLERTL